MAAVTILSHLLQHTASILHRQSDQALQERLGIGIAQLNILNMLRDNPNIQQRAIADKLGQTEASVSRQIKLLSEKGMLLTQTNPSNKREHQAAATSKGIKIAQAAEELLAEYYEPTFGQFNSKQQQQLIEMFRQIHTSACTEGKSFACDQPEEM